MEVNRCSYLQEHSETDGPGPGPRLAASTRAFPYGRYIWSGIEHMFLRAGFTLISHLTPLDEEREVSGRDEQGALTAH